MNNLKKIRENKGYSQKEFAYMIKMNPSTYNQYEKNKRQPDQETLIKIANALEVSIDEILGNKTKTIIRIPVFGHVAAGIPIEAIDDIEDYEEIPKKMASSGEYFGLTIKGHSMEPKFSTGDVVIVRKQDTAETGDIAIVLINGEEATCKKIKKTPEGILLISTNPNYEPMFFSNKDIELLPVRILGKVVELRAKFK